VTMYKTNGQLKTASEIYKDISAAVAGMDARTAAGRLSLLPGINEDMINLLIQGLPKVRELLEEGRRLVPVTEANTKAAQEYQHALTDLGDSFTGLTREIIGPFLPAAQAIVNIFSVMLLTVRDLISAIPGLTGALKVIEGLNEGAKAAMTPLGSPARRKYEDIGRVNKQKMNETLGFSPGQLLRAWGYSDLADKLYGPAGEDEERTRKAAEEAAKRLQGGSSAGGLTDLITEAAGGDVRVRQVMEGIRAGESGHGSTYDVNQIGRDDSYGPFQLNRKGHGLGWQFENETGLNLADPRTIPAQAKWVAEYLRKQFKRNPNYQPSAAFGGPWTAYKGQMEANPNWGNSGYAPQGATKTPGPGAWMSPGVMGAQGANYAGGDKNINVTVGDVHVNAPHAIDSKSIAQAVDNDLKLAILAGSANFGQIA